VLAKVFWVIDGSLLTRTGLQVSIMFWFLDGDIVKIVLSSRQKCRERKCFILSLKHTLFDQGYNHYK